ncbi:hypothetical protein ACI5KX_08195 [Erythrobacter sp. GH1-10]|uniref:hypothetical protein n=1 Tax=Erythrobacter sp. GH1-10 TaxID=3349334 RepID=UPI0038781290
MNAAHPSFARELAAAIDWWRDAGVDCDFADDATAWLADEGVKDERLTASPASAGAAATDATPGDKIQVSSAPEPSRIDLLGESPPQTLEDFHRFWLEAPGLDTIGPRGRIAPRGAHGADTMVLVVDPEEADRDVLLSGPQGKLLANILSAMGIGDSDAYVASALPRHTPMADTAAIANGGMDTVLRHHIKLASPKRIIAFGANILPLLGHDRAQDVTSLREINHDGASTPLLVSEGLDSLMSMPRLKARLWRRWMEWSS